MLQNFLNFFELQLTSLAGLFDYTCLVLAVSVLFFDKKGFTLKNVITYLIHFIGLYAAFLFVGAICNVLFAYIAPQFRIPLDNYLSKAIVILLYALFFNNYKRNAKLILSATIYAFSLVFIELGGCIQAIFNANTVENLPPIVRCGTMIFTPISAIVLRIYNVNKFRQIPRRAVIEVCVYSLIGVFLAVMRNVIVPYLLVFEKTPEYLYGLYPQLYITITLICVVILLFLCYFFIFRNIRAQEENMELSRKAMNLEISNTLIALNKSNLDQMHKIRHDIKNRCALMQIMLQNKDYDRLEEYFKDLYGEALVPFFQVDTGNSAFDLVFNLEMSKAKAKGIDVSSKLVVPPEIPVSESDLDCLIINLMDNSIEACEKVDKVKRQIDVSVQVVHNYLVMRIQNTMNKDYKESALLLETDKPDRTFHGFGSKIVDDIVKKYNGQVLRHVEDDKFIVDVMLDITVYN